VIPPELIISWVAMIVAAIWIGMMTFFVLLAEVSGSTASQARGMFLDYLFEVVSAFGTVGLSLGVTSKLSVVGKLLISLLMFVGRVGLLTFTFFIIRQTGREGTLYAEENLMIG